ncbi:Uncharacterized protein HI_1419 [Chlamydiales bacterium SCGC AG-110-P3]|nr:Uncharacterized protein HI_1419 [Chlamydiales bacterium SCGC AG-110-P3]
MTDSIKLEIYETDKSVCSYLKWEAKLAVKSRAQVRSRLNRIRLGNFGDSKPVKKGVKELRIHSGPGYRVYFGVSGKSVVLLLCGDDKGSQSRDIDKAVEYWEDYKKRAKEGQR